VKRPLAGLAVLGVVVGLQFSDLATVQSTTCPATASSSRTASGSRTSSPAPCPTPDPTQVLYDQLRARLGGDIARALTSQQQLSAALNQSAASEAVLNSQIATEEAKIAKLQAQVAQLDAKIADTEHRIEVEQAQVAALARAIYRQPHSLWELIASTGSLREALLATSDLVISGQHAHALEARLEADLTRLRAERTARLADLDRENSARDALQSSLDDLGDLMSRQDDISSQLHDLIGQIRDAQSGMHGLAPDVTANLARLLEMQERDLIQKAYRAAWSQAQIGAGLALLSDQLPAGTGLVGFILSWPIAGARITQGFGPTNVLLEPAVGPYAHFHTGIDVAAALGTPVMAAADGVVVAVAHTQVGYGNYVIVAHGGGIMTLYAHLLETDVNVGDRVMHGQRIGLEGSTGLSTGPHLHFELRINDRVVDPMHYLPAVVVPAE